MGVVITAGPSGASWRDGAWYSLAYANNVPYFNLKNTDSERVQFNAVELYCLNPKDDPTYAHNQFNGTQVTLTFTVREDTTNTATATTPSTYGYPWSSPVETYPGSGVWVQNYYYYNDYNINKFNYSNPYAQADSYLGGAWDYANNVPILTNAVKMTLTFSDLITLNPDETKHLDVTYPTTYGAGIQFFPLQAASAFVSHIIYSYHTNGGWKKDLDLYVYHNNTWVKQDNFHVLEGGVWQAKT